MGVHGLWELLSPVGRRVSVETLAGKRLAIDASIWMVQFMKAMRDERGEMVRNAHLLGFFRRICKLLFLRTKPVFVFDGATPDLKRRTVAARRRHRDSAQAKVRKTAEKLLLNHLKAMRLQELADNIKNQRQKQKSGAKGEKVLANPSSLAGSESGKNDVSSVNCNQEKLDEMLAASIAEEEEEGLANNLAAADAIHCDEDDDEDEEMILPDMIGEVDPAVLAALTPSLQLDLLQKQKRDNDAKGKKIQSINTGSNIEMGETVLSSSNQQKLDEMLAASLMEEEKRAFSNNASTSTAPYPVEDDVNMDEDEDEDEDGEEEMIVPPMDGEVDPSILASLPPSMQLDLLVQIRERLMADNRQKYQKVKKDPEKFSELQIQAYLKTVAFRREIDQVQKAASGRGVGGVQTSRIASEANREFIFSSSFTGNKQVLASGRAEECRDKQQVSEKRSSTAMPTVTSTAKLKTVTGSEERSSSVMHAAASTSKSKTVTGSEEQASRIVRTATSTSKSKTVTESELNGSRRVFDDSIETYVDEQGRVRVSRVRAMGIRMTRDLQRNLDMMKEIEQERENVNRPQSESNSALPTTFPGNPIVGTSPEVAELVKLNNADENSAINGDTSIEISFGDDGDIKCFDGDDDIFTRLVSENPGRVTSDNITPLVNLSSASDSDCDWEEGTTEANGNTLSDDANLSTKPLISEVNDSDGSEVEWEEGFREDSEHTASPVAEKRKLNSKGYLEEEADLQEAIRRSLGDKVDTKSDYVLTESDRLELPGRNACEISGFPDSKHRTEGPMFQVDDDVQQNISTCEILDGVGGGFSKTADSLGMPSKQSIVSNPDDPTPCVSSPKQLMEGGSKSASLLKELPHTESLSTSEVKEVVADGGQNTVSAPEPTFCPLVNTTNPILPFSQEEMNELIDDIDKEEKLAAKQSENTCFQEVEHGLDNSALEKDEDWHVETTEANLEEELKILDKERLNLGDERRRLERNAESVSGEMFIECQELLQMFGIPYIISPTEAEAQCAYMEIANLVDGVVTDDSDAFLFGAQSVYKNIFDDRKYVETYFMKDIENELGLTREKLISMALLLGSDYTEGISGIGIVNATEVLNAFPEEGGLKEFRGWIESPDPTILGKLDDQSDSKARKKGSSRTGNNESCSQSNITGVSVLHENSSEDQEQKQSADDIQDRKKIFMDKHRKVSKNWHVPASFPSATVISAYLSPEIDKSTEPFSWGKPDHFLLRKLCWEKFSWDSQKADELILPVLKEYNKRETQLRLEAFYTFNERFAKFRSKRIKKAVKGITGKKSLQLDDYVPKDSGSKNKRKSRQTETGDDQSENVPQGSEENVFSNQTDLEKKSTTRKPRKRTKLGTGVVSESPALSDDVEGASKRSQPSGRSRGRGRGRGSGRGKGKGSPTCEVSETSSSDDAKEVHVKTQKEPVELRRSRRARKPVEYMANDSETDDPNHSVDEKDKEYFVKEASDMSEFPASGLGQDQERNFAENVSPEQGFETDYLEKGGGFCLEEGDNNDGLPEPKEYLRTGGGFCLDEDRTRPEENSTHDRATLEAEENANLDEKETDVSEPTTDPLSARTMDQSKSRASLPENDTNCSLTIPVGALRPMPHLRKKRRKG